MRTEATVTRRRLSRAMRRGPLLNGLLCPAERSVRAVGFLSIPGLGFPSVYSARGAFVSAIPLATCYSACENIVGCDLFWLPPWWSGRFCWVCWTVWSALCIMLAFVYIPSSLIFAASITHHVGPYLSRLDWWAPQRPIFSENVNVRKLV